MPVDPESGGTSIGVNDAGLVCSLLNVYNGSTATPAPVSRGTIIPPLLRYADVDSALMWASQFDPRHFQPFRLLIVDGRELVECRSDGHALHRRRQPLRDAVIRTSSGLGDRLVARPRAALFRQYAPLPRATRSQPRISFHLHQWRGREEVSVRMRRADARTVSHTVVEVREHTVSLAYRPAEAAESVSITVAPLPHSSPVSLSPPWSPRTCNDWRRTPRSRGIYSTDPCGRRVHRRRLRGRSGAVGFGACPWKSRAATAVVVTRAALDQRFSRQGSD